MYNKSTSPACDVIGNGFVENIVTIEESPVSALEKAIAASAKGDTVVVFGSFFTIGPVLSWLESLD
jgi:folylpolyglutamate synthase/dihydropteroate synthase